MKQVIDFTIVSRVQMGTHFFALTIQHPGKMEPILPGQFVEVAVRGTREVMLRRPISIHDVDAEKNQLTLVIQVVGKGTQQLSMLKEGDTLNLVYPLGHGFGVIGEHPLLVGGGAGIAPLLYLGKCYQLRGVRPTFLLGGRSAELVFATQSFETIGDLLVATDDGSLGYHGLVTEHPQFMDRYDHICACGPTPMMRAVARSARERGIGCEVSLENMMACGIGACLCCVTPTDKGNLCVCKEGPVFDATMVKSMQ